MEDQESNRNADINSIQNEAYNRLFDSYFNKIKERFTKGNNKTRIYYIGKLEEIAAEEIPKMDRKYFFDANKAKSIRLKNGLSLRGLAQIVKMPLQSLVSYEKGFYAPGSRKGKGGRRYLEWLKDQGYEPFNLE